LIKNNLIKLLRDDKNRKFDDDKFLEGQELQPFIIKLEEYIRNIIPKTSKIMFNSTEILKECKWPEYMEPDYIIFKENIFGDETIEGKLIWSEIKTNIITHIEGMVKNPVKWALKNRFWLNSSYTCEKLGLTIHEDSTIKGKLKFPKGIKV
jgi:hypothetical protein